MKRLSLLILPLTLLATSPASLAESAAKATAYRQSVMQIFKWNSGPLGGMASGKVPYDAKVFEQHARDMIAAGRLDLLGGFPEDSEHPDSSALSEIWLDWETFEARHGDFSKALDELEKSLAGEDQQARFAAFGDVGKSCKGCHKAFKE